MMLTFDTVAWRDYVNELQEAKLRALGVSFAEEEPPAPPSPLTSGPSRQASAQYPALPFSPPIPTSSASSNHATMGYPFPNHFNPTAAQSPGVPSGHSPVPFGHSKFNPRQSISFPTTGSPFQLTGQSPQGWHHMQAYSGTDSPSFGNLNGLMSPQSPYGLDGIRSAGSPVFIHGRQQSLQYPMLTHQHINHTQSMRNSPRLQEVREDDDEELSKSPSKTPEPFRQADDLQAEIEDAEYHLEEQLRNQLEHEDYNPVQQPNAQAPHIDHERKVSHDVAVSEHFANEPGKPLTLHHPRPHSRGHSLTQNFYRDQDANEEGNLKAFAALNDIPEGQKTDEAYEVETNPSNLGTPVHSFDFSTAISQHQKSASVASNPWTETASARSLRHLSHESKPSFSKLNVQAPEFKFNPSNAFTPGQFSFGGQSFQPAVFQASTQDEEVKEQFPTNSVLSFTGSTKTKADPNFAPSQSEFSFSSSGPKFRPDAPAFTPTTTIINPSGDGAKHRTRESIFNNIEITTDIVKPAKNSKAIPILAPSGETSDATPSILEEKEDEDGRLVDPARAKRAKSARPDDEDVPLFAEQPTESTLAVQEPLEPDVEASAVASVETEPVDEAGEMDMPADTSMSSAITTEQTDTKATTAAPSETSPTSPMNTDKLVPFKFGEHVNGDMANEDESPDEKVSHFKHRKTLSATAPIFMPGGKSSFGAGSFSFQPSTSIDVTPTTPQQAAVESPAGSPTPSARSPSPQPKPSVVSKGLGASRFASPPPKPKGLAASRYATEPSPSPEPMQQEETPSVDDNEASIIESVEKEDNMNMPVELDSPADTNALVDEPENFEPTFEDIDAIMQQIENDPSLGVNRVVEHQAQQSSSTEEQEHTPLEEVSNSPIYKLESPVDSFIKEASVSTARDVDVHDELGTPVMSDELEDPFVDQLPKGYQSGEAESPPASNWEEAFSADEHDKLQSRAQFFDGRVNELVGNLLTNRLVPLEQTLSSIQDALSVKAARSVSSRRELRSTSAERQQSDADDEDEEPMFRRSMSPRRDRKLEQVRVAVMDGLAAHYKSQHEVTLVAEKPADDNHFLVAAIAEMEQRLIANVKPSFDGEDLKAIVETAVQSRMPPTPEPDIANERQLAELEAKVADLEHRLQKERDVADKEINARRVAEDTAADLGRQLQAAETRVEVEIINRSVFDQRVTDLEEKLRHQEGQTEEEVKARRTAEDRLSETQRLLRISSEEEARLREQNEENSQRIRTMEQVNSKSSMKMTLLEASQTNSTQSQTEMTNKLNVLEADLRNVRQDNNYWRGEAERADEAARRVGGELGHALEENKHMSKSLSTLSTQLEENERLRENWRSKFLSLQDDMGHAAREIAEDNARRIKKDQAMFARQEVLDARLQAEAKTRERLEIEMERLQTNERTGMRATNECQRLEGLLGDLRTENHKLSQRILEVQRNFEEARESAEMEVHHTRASMQSDIDEANHQVNFVRRELEEQNMKLRAELDTFKLEADAAKARYDMLLEEAETTKVTEVKTLREQHQNELEDIQTRHEQQRSTSMEESSKTEQHLLERLSFSSTKIDHLQDRILHLEERLEVSKEAAAAAIAAAKSTGTEQRSMTSGAPTRRTSQKLDAPEKISPQALRESIMVLQEQLQAREQRIEELEQTVSELDPDATSKISKRDDEITWLRELLAVRHGDLQDIITTLSSASFDRIRVKDAAIRLKANLQMEQQERERAMNGGSAITLPAIAHNIAASPRVAQAVAPLAAAWGNWRKSSQSSFSGVPARMNAPSSSSRNATPSRRNSQFSGLMTPPASGARQSPLVDSEPQPTAFGSTGRRFASRGSMSSASGRVRGLSTTSRQAEKMPAEEAPAIPFELDAPRTPPVMRPTGYDSDAQPGDFDDEDFFEDS